ncbi:hypothetical protein [uncultured Thiothrix sp.]|mgnify:CR=1 FL=1|uniref:hypothetical protein n=1 Tax=uncultured Thiothrix sp. TaxID=223185 RepID=UPI0026023738|nr:hypothetical protein [uncultured Thiothrix sp.]HMT93182.1 hypothetical protein [Thiolinea sp.]
MSDVLEYLFFTRTIADQFAAALQERLIAYQEVIEAVQEAIVFKVPESVGEQLWDELDDLYDELSVADQALLEAAIEDDTAQAAAGVYLQLANGQQTIAQVDPALVNRILSVLSLEEFNQFLDTLVKSVEQPNAAAICQR